MRASWANEGLVVRVRASVTGAGSQKAMPSRIVEPMISLRADWDAKHHPRDSSLDSTMGIEEWMIVAFAMVLGTRGGSLYDENGREATLIRCGCDAARECPAQCSPRELPSKKFSHVGLPRLSRPVLPRPESGFEERGGSGQ